MPRKTRIETPGYHHIYNRGVERRFVYEEDSDKERFLKILCEVSEHYSFTIHAYVLMDNHYHLLIENKKENLSSGMRQINSIYAQYFNKKYNRVGHLWQDRYKSWCVLNENYLFTLFKYFESNPIEAKLSKYPGEYRWTLLHDIKRGEIPPCMQQSFILDQYDTATLLENLDMSLSETEKDRLEEIKKESNRLKRSKEIKSAPLDLESFFEKMPTKDIRDKKIAEAYTLGATQSEIAKRLKLSVSAVSKIVKKSKIKP